MPERLIEPPAKIPKADVEKPERPVSAYGGKRRAIIEMYAFRIEAARQNGDSAGLIAAIREEQHNHLAALKRHEQGDRVEHREEVRNAYRDVAAMMHSLDRKPNRDEPPPKFLTYELKTG